MFSKSCEYAIRATLLIATRSLEGNKVSVKDIAEATGSPVAFIGKVLQQLTKGGIVHSVQGVHGGFEIGRREMEGIRLSEIVSTIDGDRIFTG
ncbi:MAG: Rrf2 family transcriptional regulator, partial [Bacteroidota bacterium]